MWRTLKNAAAGKTDVMGEFEKGLEIGQCSVTTAEDNETILVENIYRTLRRWKGLQVGGHFFAVFRLSTNRTLALTIWMLRKMYMNLRQWTDLSGRT